MAYQRVQQLRTFTSLVSVPFVKCEFGGVEFGLTSKFNQTTRVRSIVGLTSLEVSKKASGQVNTYTATIQYLIEPGSDPNYIDYVIASATDRKIYFTYGDTAQPSYSFVREQALITNIQPSINIANNLITYTITATSSVSLNYATTKSYPQQRNVKPSKLILDTLYDSESKLTELFTGMQDRNTVVKKNNWIDQNDDVIASIDAKTNITPLEYIRYLVSIMTSGSYFYSMVIVDEPTDGEADGPYFKVVKSEDQYTVDDAISLDVDVGYPGDTPVLDFSPSQNTSIALINQFSGTVNGTKININEVGEDVYAGGSDSKWTPSFTITNGKPSEQLKTWWNNMTNYPINATLKTRGLIRPSILCEYLNINVLFFGQRYNYSGLYMVTAQKDSISESGYITELTLVRVGGDSI